MSYIDNQASARPADARVGPPVDKMPGHWLLARMGKRVLRPGGLELTRQLLDELTIGQCDNVVEFAPGLGVTARMTLALRPQSYTAIERDLDAAAIVQKYLPGPNQRCVLGTAEDNIRSRNQNVFIGCTTCRASLDRRPTD